MTRDMEVLASATPSPLITVHRLNQLHETYKFAAPYRSSTDDENEKFNNAVAFIWYAAVFYTSGGDKTLYRFNRSLEQVRRDWWVDILSIVHTRLSEIILKEELYELMRRVDKLEKLVKRIQKN